VEAALSKSAFIFASAWSRGIKTIKMGLTENEVLRRKIAAGPFHPAFGDLVRSEGFCLAILRKAGEAGIIGEALIRINPRDAASLTGRKGAGLAKLKSEGIMAAWAAHETMEKEHFVIEGSGKRATGSLADSLAMLPF